MGDGELGRVRGRLTSFRALTCMCAALKKRATVLEWLSRIIKRGISANQQISKSADGYARQKQPKQPGVGRR